MLLSGLSYANASHDNTSDYLSIDNDVGVSIECNYTLLAHEVLQVGELVTGYVIVEPYTLIRLSVLELISKVPMNRLNTPQKGKQVQTNLIRAGDIIKDLHIADVIRLRGLINSFNKFDTKTA